MQIVLFARDDSAAPDAVRRNLQPFDTVDITDLSDADLGVGITESPDFYIVDCDCTYDDVKHLKDEHINIAAENYEVFHQRLYSLDLLPPPFLNALINTGRVTIPLGLLIANQRIKS